MGKEVDNKFTWIIKNFSSQPTRIYSDEFVVDGCKWRLMAYPKGNNVDHLSLYLDVATSDSLPSGWKRLATVQFTIVNQLLEKFSQTKETLSWFDSRTRDWGFTSMFPLVELHRKDGGFLVNGEVKIVAVVNVLEVVGKRDVPDEVVTDTKSVLEDDDGVESSDVLEDFSSVMESLDVNGFQVLPSQVESVRRIFEKHPEIASEFRLKNQHLRSACMSVLLGLIETLCQSTQELSKDDLADANAALGYLKDTGLNLDWLEEKLKQVTEKKEIEEAGETRMQEIEEELKELKLKCSNLEAELDKEKANVSAAKTPLSFDDVV